MKVNAGRAELVSCTVPHPAASQVLVLVEVGRLWRHVLLLVGHVDGLRVAHLHRLLSLHLPLHLLHLHLHGLLPELRGWAGWGGR